jgi:hypothetical protein
MSSLYIVIDQFGLIGGFSKLDTARALIENHPKVPLMIIQFPLDINEQKEEFYFIPYVQNNAVAIATNNKKYALNIKTQLLTVSMTYPDPLQFYTREINKVHELELRRLITPEIHAGDPNLLDNINDIVGKMESMTAVGGMYHEQYNILDPIYGDIVKKVNLEETHCPDKHPSQPEGSGDTTPAEIPDS